MEPSFWITVAHTGHCGGNFHLLPLFSQLCVAWGRLGLVSAVLQPFVCASQFSPPHTPLLEKAPSPGSLCICAVLIPDSRGPSLSENFPACLFTLVAHLQLYPVLNWYGFTNQRELGATQASVAFSTHFLENCRTSGIQRPFICPSPGRPQVSLMSALTIWNSVFSICLQEAFLAPSLPCLLASGCTCCSGAHSFGATFLYFL